MKLSTLLNRIISSVITLLILASVTFVLLRFAPGSPFDSERNWPPEIKANLEKRYGLDQPLSRQFTAWFSDLMHGDLRESLTYINRPVSEIISESLSTSIYLGSAALFLALFWGISLGALSAIKKNTWLDYASVFISVSGVSLPSFLVASLLILIFSLKLGWFPPALLETKSAYILPILTLAFRPLAMIARMTRASLLEVMDSDYIRTAYAKGLAPKIVVFKHGLKNALIPVITLLGPITANLVTGSFLVETVFQLPGLGKHFVGSVLNRDYTLAMGITLVYGAILLTLNLIVDLLYQWADPRMKQN